ncbi:hypothetical protein EIY72_15570 [Pseudomonas vancouverensis]|uniref:Uncharacterized protein n=1 Tax=Pseudomonas vancouverensis TaxID=95300 RepID=A0A4R4K2M4_PSEVA|nr:hypothetical protein F7R09_19920 [Pseudomonas vancouverensis]TDB61483.1 hypothetical protein EIY72_15570 [Pseudomonas vancouverensis]
MWERACSRCRQHRQHLHRLKECHREQAHSHSGSRKLKKTVQRHPATPGRQLQTPLVSHHALIVAETNFL